MSETPDSEPPKSRVPSSMMIANRYRLTQRAGAGGMAEVFRGELFGPFGFQKPVAIKCILEHLAHHHHFVRMFAEEARIQACLHHPNIVQVYDFGVDAGLPYLVLEWVDGITLLDWLRYYYHQRQHTPAHLGAAIVLEALKGLGAAHGNAGFGGPTVIHRDISLSNVMITARGVVKLSDFGLARACDGLRLTPDGAVQGKLRYFAPELLQGAGHSVQTDLYALGIVLFELISGRRYFERHNDAMVLEVLRDGNKRPVLQHWRQDVPPVLVDIVHQAIAEDPDNRFQTARQFERALADFLRSHWVPAHRAIVAEEVQAIISDEPVDSVDIPVIHPSETPPPFASADTMPDSVPISVTW